MRTLNERLARRRTVFPTLVLVLVALLLGLAAGYWMHATFGPAGASPPTNSPSHAPTGVGGGGGDLASVPAERMRADQVGAPRARLTAAALRPWSTDAGRSRPSGLAHQLRQGRRDAHMTRGTWRTSPDEWPPPYTPRS